MGTIYIVTNLMNQKQYVGQTTKPFQKRLRYHLYESQVRNSHLVFHKALRKYGLINFKWIKIEYPDEELNMWEEYYIKLFDTQNPNGYNSTIGGGGIKGHHFKHTEETKMKIGLGNQGKEISLETRNKLRAKAIGRKPSEESRIKMSLAHTGEKNHFYGKQHTEESLKKMRTPRSEEFKNTMRNVRLGTKQSEEQKEKHRKFMIEYWKNKKGEN
jgi:group I intron endonuclease